ncbi:MAG: hypothetical protein AAF351_09035 [Pseudomonadota bacterium]
MTEKLLRLVGPLHVVGGLLLFLTGLIPSAADWLEATFSGSQTVEWSRFFAAVMGPTIASWGLLFWGVVDQYYRSPSLRLWRLMVSSIGMWAVLDTFLCLQAGWQSAVVLNTVVVVVVGFLLWTERPTIHK